MLYLWNKKTMMLLSAIGLIGAATALMMGATWKQVVFVSVIGALGAPPFYCYLARDWSGLLCLALIAALEVGFITTVQRFGYHTRPLHQAAAIGAFMVTSASFVLVVAILHTRDEVQRRRAKKQPVTY